MSPTQQTTIRGTPSCERRAWWCQDSPPPLTSQWVLESGASTLQRALLRRGMNIFHQRRNEKPFCLPIQPCPPFSLSPPTSLPPPVCVFVVVVAPPPAPPHNSHYPSTFFHSSLLIPPTLFFLAAEAPLPRGECFSLRLFSSVCATARVKRGAGQQKGGRKGSIHVCIL